MATTIPRLRPTSITSPGCCKPPTGSARRSRCCAALATFFAFQRGTGHAHPERDPVISNYTDLLAAMGRSEPEIDGALAGLRREVGLDQA